MKVNRVEIFLERAKQKHNNKYDYSKVEYVNAHTKVCIICPIHGEFWQTPNCHLNGNGCPKCSCNKNFTTEEFIEKAKEIHGNKYDYSKVEYVNAHTKVCIICPIHGEFWQTPSNHLRERGCPKCKSRKNLVKKYNPNINHTNKKKLTTEEFIKAAKQVHGDKYDYSKVDYKNNKTKICIICPIHGEFWQRPDNHLNNGGCKKCSIKEKSKNRANTLLSFIKAAKQVHGDKYDYSKVEYVNTKTPICIICPIHGEFWQKPYNHLQGRGCQECNKSHLEEEVENFLKNEKINFISQYKPSWLLNNKNKQLSIDFYLIDFNVVIECQGEQHFNHIPFFGNYEKFLKQCENDLIKKKLCLEHGIKIIYFSKNKITNSISSLTTLKSLIV